MISGVDPILIVDDNSMNRQILAEKLSTRGHEVVEAEGGAQAMELIESRAFEAVILDVMMPGIDGVEVCRRIDHHSTKVLMLTALGDVTTEVASLEAGARGYLTKPFSSMELLDRVEELLKQ